MQTLVVVLYDSITNSVFHGQVLEPLFQRKKQNPALNIILVSFEYAAVKAQAENIMRPYNDRMQTFFIKKLPFLGTITLFYAIKKLHTLLRSLNSYELLARGPHAGFIALHATAKTNFCNQLTIQARGLLAEEYAYVHNNKQQKLSYWHAWRKTLFEHLEHRTYSLCASKQSCFIEAVSVALKEYLTNQWQIDPAKITIAQNDIPQQCLPDTLNQWRIETRKQFAIAGNTQVYCFNGSCKPWQCPQEAITFFAEQYQKNNNSFLLVLTQDKEDFDTLLQRHRINPSCYKGITVPHSTIYRYLAAADVGLVFREPHVINWVSRPTKVLEYKAAGLRIVHNNTIAALTEKPL